MAPRPLVIHPRPVLSGPRKDMIQLEQFEPITAASQTLLDTENDIVQGAATSDLFGTLPVPFKSDTQFRAESKRLLPVSSYKKLLDKYSSILEDILPAYLGCICEYSNLRRARLSSMWIEKDIMNNIWYKYDNALEFKEAIIYMFRRYTESQLAELQAILEYERDGGDVRKLQEFKDDFKGSGLDSTNFFNKDKFGEIDYIFAPSGNFAHYWLGGMSPKQRFFFGIDSCTGQDDKTFVSPDHEDTKPAFGLWFLAYVALAIEKEQAAEKSRRQRKNRRQRKSRPQEHPQKNN